MTRYPVRKLAICGPIRAGKDAVADYLAREHAFEKFAFATRMKSLLHELFPHIPAEPKPRRAYQEFGEGIRNLPIEGAEHVWINACLRLVNSHIWWHSEVDNRGANVVITDLRLPAEYERLKDEGFTIIRVTAPDQLRMDRAVAAGDDFTVHDFVHDTEQHVNGFVVDAEIVNDGTLSELYAKIDEIVAKMEAVD